jgi:threonylcarbamoyladenosine tRNA methylthiotransferase MtaB
VTHTADAKARHLLSRVRRRQPGVFIVATGCYAEGNPAELSKYVDLLVTNADKDSLFEKLEASGRLHKITGTTLRTTAIRRARSFVKIQDGCTNYCAYCIVPYVRGIEKSLPIDEITSTVKKLEADGYQEVVLTGTRIGAYDDRGTDLKSLIEQLLRETSILRFRLSSLQPQEITPGLIELWGNKRLCPHFHLSLQSGSDSVLKRMNRLYTLADYEQTVNLIRASIPEVAITTDVIVGFPGETDAEFNKSLEFCRRMEFARIHVFMYSPRAGTEAAAMPGQVNEKVKKARSQEMLAVSRQSTQDFKDRFSGEILDVLWEKQDEDGQWSGVTGNYIRVFKKDDGNLENRVSKVKLGK